MADFSGAEIFGTVQQFDAGTQGGGVMAGAAIFATVQEFSAGTMAGGVLAGAEVHGVVQNFATGGIVKGKVLRASLLARDLVELVFEDPVRREAALVAVTSYAVAATDASETLTVRKVMAEDDPKVHAVTVVYLNVSPPTAGKEYRITVSEAVRTAAGSVLHSRTNAAKFVGRRTKMDAILDTRSPMYTMTPGGVYRGMLGAAAREDDLLGGSRKDRLP